MSIADAALEYIRAGFSVIPIRPDGSKAPAISVWSHFQQERPEESAVAHMFSEGCGIAVIGGNVSGGLEVIDFDDASLFEPWKAMLETTDPGLVERLPVVKTPNGFHVYFRSGECQPNNPRLAKSLKKIEGKKGTTLIETRGEGGYVIAPPSPTSVHESGLAYEHISGPRITRTPRIAIEERRMLLDAARSFNEVDPEQHRDVPKHLQATQGRPGDDFAEKTTWQEILTPHDWKLQSSSGGKQTWCRPGKRRGISATTGHTGDKLYVFSSNAEPFDANRAYSKFGAYCVAPGTLVLDADLLWRRAGDLEVGDSLVGIDEEIAKKHSRRKLRVARVEYAERKTLPCAEIRFEDGRVIIASLDHRWLASSAGCGGNTRWIRTADLRAGQRISTLTNGTWERATDFDSGWLSGMYDGEGWFSGTTVGLSQKAGPVFDRAQTLLLQRGFEPKHNPGQNAEHLKLHSLPDIFRLLGTLQPRRLVCKRAWVGRGAWTRVAPEAKVLSVRHVGDMETAAIQTTTRTFIAEGLVSHNSLLNFGGDFAGAARQLRAEGYGTTENQSPIAGNALANVPPRMPMETPEEPESIVDEAMTRCVTLFDEAVEEWMTYKAPPIIPTGIPSLDKAMTGGLPVGQLVSLLGYTGAGKSEVVRQMRGHAAREGYPVVHVDVELGMLRIIERELAQRSGLPPSVLRKRDEMNDKQHADVLDAMADLKEFPIALVNRVHGLPMPDLREIIAQALEKVREKAGKKNGLIVLDSIQRLAAGSPQDQQRLQVQHFLWWAAGLATELECSVIATGEQKRATDGGRPSPADILTSGAESRSIEYVSDYVIGLVPEGKIDEEVAGGDNITKERYVSVIVAKAREGTVGYIRDQLAFVYPTWDMKVVEREDELTAEILEAIASEPKSGTAIAKEIQKRKNNVLDRLNMLQDENRVEFMPFAKKWRIPE